MYEMTLAEYDATILLSIRTHTIMSIFLECQVFGPITDFRIRSWHLSKVSITAFINFVSHRFSRFAPTAATTPPPVRLENILVVFIVCSDIACSLSDSISRFVRFRALVLAKSTVLYMVLLSSELLLHIGTPSSGPFSLFGRLFLR